MLSSSVAIIVRYASRCAIIVAVIALLLGLAGGYYTLTHFAMNTNSDNLVAPDVAWRHNEKHYDAAFPQQNNTIVVVIDGDTAERSDEAANTLTEALKKNNALFLSVRQPDGGPFLTREGLLLLPKERVKKIAQRLISAEPFLGGMAVDPSLRGVMNTFGTILLGARHGQVTPAALDKLITAIEGTLQKVLTGTPTYFGWSTMIGGSEQPRGEDKQRFIVVKPRLDYLALLPGKRATDAIREAAKELGLTRRNGILVRLTGPVPMADGAFASIAHHGMLLAAFMCTTVLLMLWLAVRSARLILAIIATVIIGLVITASIGLTIYGAFNVISVAFIELFVGLGVDFSIQYCVRYRAERHVFDDLREALYRAGHGIGPGLTLAAFAAAASFFSFLPTDYAGVAELGVIAGSGMIVTYILSITALPAFLTLLRPRGERADIGFLCLAPVDAFLKRRAPLVLGSAFMIATGSAILIPLLRFDSNPLHLENPNSESVATALDLMKNPRTSPNTVNVLQSSRSKAVTLANRLSKLPEVSRALTIDSFVPNHQTTKLKIIKDAAQLLDPIFNPFVKRAPPSDRETVASIRQTARTLRVTSSKWADPIRVHAEALVQTLNRLAQTDPTTRARAAHAFVPGLNTLFEQLRIALHPKPISFETLPASLVRDWVSPDGLYRVQVFPSGNSSDNAVLERFTRAVLRIAPDATGTPIIVLESGKTIVRAFIDAGIYSLIAITLILMAVLRRIGDVMMALVPLGFAGLMTVASCVVAGIPLNFANIIALPLLFGIGVAFDIYFVMAWRRGHRNLLQSPLTRAVIMSAGTTAAAFGTLSISSHPGTASMGTILLLSLFWILISILILLPTLLRYALPHEGLVTPLPEA